MRTEKNMILREIAGEYILIPTGSLALKYTGVFAISSLGVSVWKLLEADKTYEQIITDLLEEYEVDRETLERDVREFLDTLREKELLFD
jgi:hypothetical protein